MIGSAGTARKANPKRSGEGRIVFHDGLGLGDRGARRRFSQNSNLGNGSAHYSTLHDTIILSS